MGTLSNSKHELFCQKIAIGLNEGEAYIAAGYHGGRGAAVSASRLLKKANIRARIDAIRSEVVARTIEVAVRDRNWRLKRLQDELDRMDKIKDERAAVLPRDDEGNELAQPGWASGLLCLDFKGKEANVAVFKFDAELVRQYNETLKQAAIEEGQWTEKREVSGAVAIVERLKAARTRVSQAK